MEYNQIKTFEDACKALNIETNVPDFSASPAKHQKALLAHYKLVIIVEAANEGWQPDWSSNEYKYTLWPDVEEDKTKSSGFGLSFNGVDGWYTDTYVGSRLCFKNRNVAEYIFETFKELYEDYLLIG